MTSTIASGPSASAPTDGSRTLIITDSNPREEGDPSNAPDGPSPPVGLLRLRGGPRNTQRVVWGEDVVDNEGCGRKSSKSTFFQN
jgi:protein phosphatase 1 regulatory subunit 11